jgi:outer membrane receptor protein involved in Fe transport
VLVNGKRRHTTALVNLFGARNRGNTGTDMNAIPLLAIKDVQVLRDGAAAQYGSDAIAGVMDIGLKKSKGCEAVAGYSEYSKATARTTCLGLLRRRGRQRRRARHHRRIPTTAAAPTAPKRTTRAPSATARPRTRPST